MQGETPKFAIRRIVKKSSSLRTPKMKHIQVFAWLAVLALAVPAVSQDDLLGKKRGGGSNSGGSNSGGSSDKGRDRDPKPNKGSGGSGPSAPQRGNEGKGNGNGNSNGGGQDRRGNGGSAPQRGAEGNGGRTGDRPTVIIGDRNGNAPVRNQGRTGTPQYGSVNNRDRSRGTVNIGSTPSYNDIVRQAGREENVVRRSNSYRSGYYSYDNRWRDDNFCYPHYNFEYSRNCNISPFYAYPHLPGYINHARVSFDVFSLRVNLNFNYQWQPQRRYDRYSSTYDLDLAIRDLDTAFDQKDRRALDALVPRYGRVTVRNRWDRPYSLNSDDFYDMLSDLVLTTRTENFHILGVNTGRNYARVYTRHDFWDAWGQIRTTFQMYTLEQNERNQYEIVEFQIDEQPIRY